MYFSVNTMHEIWYGIGMEVWKIVVQSILASSIFHTEISFHSIPVFIPFYIMPCCRFYTIIIIVPFYPSGCGQLENPEAYNFEKIASASSSFSTLLFPRSLPLPTSFIKVLPLPQKLTASTASASSFLFHIPDYKSDIGIQYMNTKASVTFEKMHHFQFRLKIKFF